MPRLLDTSVVLQFARRVAAGSVACRFIAGFFRTLARDGRAVIAQAQRVEAAVGGARPPKPDPHDEQRVKAVLAQSRLVQWIDAALDVPPRAWRSSAVRRVVEPTLDEVRALPAPEQVRLFGWMLVAAAMTHVVLVVVFSEPVGWPTWLAWGTFLALACGLVRWAPQVVAAWANRRPWVRRLLRESEPWR